MKTQQIEGVVMAWLSPIECAAQRCFQSTVALPGAISHKVSLKPKLCASATLIQKTSKNEPKHGPKNGTAWRSHFWGRMHSLVKEQKKSTFTVPFWARLAVPKMRPQNRKIHSKGRPLQPTKNYNWVYLSNQHIDLEQRRPVHAKPDFN